MIYPGVIMERRGRSRSLSCSCSSSRPFSSMFRQREHSAAGFPQRVSSSAMSHALKTYWWVVIVTVFGLFHRDFENTMRNIGRQAEHRSSPCSRRRYSATCSRKSAVCRGSHGTLGTLISSGVSILDGLEITAKDRRANRVIQGRDHGNRAPSIAGGETICGATQENHKSSRRWSSR